MFSKKEKDYYRVLNVSRDASPDEIKKSFRKLAIQYHPDKNPGDKEKENRFKEINEAYEVLSDPKKKSQYDQFGFVGDQNASYASSSGFGDFKDIFGDFEGIFDNFFGGRSSSKSSRSTYQKGRDLLLEMQVSFKDAFLGCKVNIQIPRNEICSSCSGKGVKAGFSKSRCVVCNGSGSVQKTQGFFTISSDCYQCRGSGEVIKDPCLQCNGFGLFKKIEDILVNVPRGIEEKSRIRISQKGDAVVGGINGDLYVEVKIKKDSNFTRQGLDLFCVHSILFTQAALGADVVISTLEGKIELKIPPGAQNNQLFRFKGHGCYKINSSKRGDLYVRINIIVPENLTSEERSILEKFADLRGEKYKKTSSFYDRIKKKFN